MADNDTVLRIEDNGAVRLLTLNRPPAKNAFNKALYDSTRIALDEAAADDGVTVVVITGAGDAFSAGQDLKALANLKENPDEIKGFEPFAQALARFDKPLIAAVNGVAVGVGATLLGHCDLVLVSEAARFKFPFVKLGMIPEAASSMLLPATIGLQAAAYHLLTGDWLSAEDAVGRGLAWKCCATGSLLEETLALALRIAEAPLESVRSTKRLLQAGRAEAVTAALDREHEYLVALTRRYLES